MLARTLANPPKLDAQLVAIWTTVMEAAGMSAADVRRGAALVITQERFFPAPAVLIQAVRPAGDADAETELAWQRALSCVRNVGRMGSLIPADVHGDGACLWALSRVGWERLCHELGDENRAILRAEFVRTYRLARTTGASADYVVGEAERLNAANGRELTPALVGRPEWPALPGQPVPLPAKPKALPEPEFAPMAAADIAELKQRVATGGFSSLLGRSM